MTYYIMTAVNVALSLMVGAAFFIFAQTKAIDMRDASLLAERAKQIKPGEVYRFTFKATPLKPERSQDYIVKDVSGGYVSYVHARYPTQEPDVERATEFLKYKTKLP